MVLEKHILTRFFHEPVQYLEPLPQRYCLHRTIRLLLSPSLGGSCVLSLPDVLGLERL